MSRGPFLVLDDGRTIQRDGGLEEVVEEGGEDAAVEVEERGEVVRGETGSEALAA